MSPFGRSSGGRPFAAFVLALGAPGCLDRFKAGGDAGTTTEGASAEESTLAPSSETTPPGTSSASTSSADASSVSATSTSETDGEASGSSGCDAQMRATTVCEGDVADVPNALWGDSVLVRPPEGPGEFVEANSFFATLTPEPTAFESCVEGCPPALIEFGAVGNGGDLATPLSTQARDLADNLGYPTSTTFSDEIDRGDAYYAVLDAPADRDDPPSRSRLHFTIQFDTVYWVVYRCSPDDWNALTETFLLSMESLVALPPG